MYVRNDIVRVIASPETLQETQFLPTEIGQEITGKDFRVICSYKDKSYDLEGTEAKLDNSVLGFVRHATKEDRKVCKKIGHTYSENFNRGCQCIFCFKRKPFIGIDQGAEDGDKSIKVTGHMENGKIVVDKMEYGE